MKKYMLPAFPAAMAGVILGAAPPDSGAGEKIPLEVAHVFFELNHTDGDLGIHSLLDGEPWKRLKIDGPDGQLILDINVAGRLQQQGLTEIFFESAEPPFESDEDDEVSLAPEEFFKRFPEGMYVIEGETIEGDELQGETQLTHTMPAPPAPTVNGKGLAEECEVDDPEYDAPRVNAPVTIEWPEVKMSHPDLGTMPPANIVINNYQLVVEVADGDEFAPELSIMLAPGATSMTIPADFTVLGKKFKYEVLARTQSYNQTAIENCFQL